MRLGVNSQGEVRTTAQVHTMASATGLLGIQLVSLLLKIYIKMLLSMQLFSTSTFQVIEKRMRERDVLVKAKRKHDLNPSISSVMKSGGQRCLAQSG